jgi:hypothetical protein
MRKTSRNGRGEGSIRQLVTVTAMGKVVAAWELMMVGTRLPPLLVVKQSRLKLEGLSKNCHVFLLRIPLLLALLVTCQISRRLA